MRRTLDNRNPCGRMTYPQMIAPRAHWRRLVALVAGCLLLTGGQPPSARAEAMLQLFNVSWAEVTKKMPELAEAGYGSLWLPPPTKGSGGLSVGYDMWDPFDLGSKNQRDTVRTRYGTEAELLELVETAHRFGIRIYFDNIMNHRAFDVPGYNENTAIDVYPGMVPEDFHLRKTEDGFYRKWDNTRDWGSAWQVQNLGLADLIDIAHETPNANFGTSEGSTHPKYSFIRDLERPAQYDKDKDGNQAYFGVLIDQARAELGLSASNEDVRLKARSYILANTNNAFVEDVGAYLIRAVRWKMDRTKADGLRLDAVKHVPDYFFGQQTGADKDSSDAGYLGGVQWQFNRTRGFSDANHRDSVFDEKRIRDDAMVFGEHLGQPPGYGGYWDAGMRLVDNDLRSKLNGVLGNMWSGLQGLDAPGAGGFAASLGVTHANSHDSDYAAQKEWQHAFYMTREGMGLIYSDGYNKAETLGESGGAFPRHANTAYLGQFGDPRIPNILKLHNDFARGLQQGRWADGDYLAFERRDNRNPDGSVRSANAAEEITMVMMMNDNTAQGQARGISTSFPGSALLYQYAEGPSGSSMTGFYKFAGELGSVTVPPGGYFLFSYRTPELSTLWPDAAITLYQANASTGQLQEVPRITVTRKDGRDGDKSFNPYGLANRGYPTNATPVDYTYQTSVPVVKGNTPLTILARADGSAENILIKLDGGVDLNGTGLGTDPAQRDNPPGLRTDVYLGYEQPTFIDRQHPEKFAAEDTKRSRIGSPGAETYVRFPDGSYSVNLGPTNGAFTNNFSSENGNVVSWIYHSPTNIVGGPAGTNGVGSPQFGSIVGTNMVLWAKTPTNIGSGYKMFVYYTTGGASYPEGAGGIGRGETRVAEFDFRHDETGNDPGSWWSATNLPSSLLSSEVRYKIGVYRTEKATNRETPSWWPGSLDSVTYKKKMLTTFRVAEFDPANVQHFPHNDYARAPTLGEPYEKWPWAMRTGLAEGFHVMRARAFLPTGKGGRSLDAAPLYQTFVQTFYYDALPPQGTVAWPANNGDTVGGSSYELVIRTDSTVEEVWYHIDDSDARNNDSATKQLNGNGAGFEPFDDANQNGLRDAAEDFTDVNGNGIYDISLSDSWAKATEVTAPEGVTQKEWRFRYNNIPASGEGTIKIRLLEASSSRDLTLSPGSANVTELTRSVQTRGPDERVMIAWPQSDGNRVDDNYTMKVYFTKELANGISEQQLKDRFTFTIASRSSGSSEGAVAQSRSDFIISYDVNDQFHELAVPLPNMYNGIADFLHTLKVVYAFPDDHPDTAKRGLKLEAVRLATANPSTKPFIRIIRPTEVGSDGKPTEIILRDVPGPDSLDYEVWVETSTNVVTAPTLNGIATNNALPVVPGATANTWKYNWSITAPGTYPITATTVLNGQTNSTSRNARVILRQVVDADGTTDNDDDNDGLIDIDETNQKPLPPEKIAENYNNGDVHLYYATGRSLPTSPDSDGDGLPDGLEVGWRGAISPPTDTSIDTNGDGVPNFRGDLDPPLYAVVENAAAVPGVGDRSQGDLRTRQAAGTVTDPTNADTDGDGILDGIEDANINGWTDGDGKALPLAAAISQYTVERPNPGDWPNNIIDFFETWAETSPSKADSDDDGLKDGYGEDKNCNGLIEGDTNTNRRYDAGEAWTETDPLNEDTDADGLPDGWEDQFGLDLLDNGTDSYRTAALNDGNANSGADGDPDGDRVKNIDELAAGTNPNQPNNPGGGGVGEGAIRIGQFTDWTHTDLLALDEYNEGGSQGADVYRSWNNTDNSRDIVAFSFRDGGEADGRVYFRIDFLDLAAYAEQGEVDAYIVIDTGNPAAGERALPNGVDIATEMGWEAVVAVYATDFGTVFTDSQRTNNTQDKYQDPGAAFGVQTRPFGAPGLNRAAWSSVYDALEISIDRQSLIDAGWLGDPNTLNFQVFTTKPNTQAGGTGDIAGRNDIRDTVSDDWITSDYWKDQDNIQLNEKLSYYFGRDLSQGNINNRKFNDRNKSAKVMLVAHGNQTIQPASVTQALIRSGTPPVGYSRLLQTHEAYNAPLTLHITPTLASALQWAVNPSAGAWPNNDGPSFNAKLRDLIATGRVSLLGSSFSDHIPKYFLQEFNNSNKELAEQFLDAIYGNGNAVASRSIFWAPERVLDSVSLETIYSMGYRYVFADQMKHFVKWFGRTPALGTDGYCINEVNGMKIFPIHDVTSAYLEQTLDYGSSLPVRQLLSRRSRSNVQDQVVVMWKDLGDFSTDAKATSYDSNVRWLSSRPWVRVVTAQQIAEQEISYPGRTPETSGNTYTQWSTVFRGTGQILPQTSKDWIDHATQGSYDNWYHGSSSEEGLKNRTFGATEAFGQVGVSGHANQAWLAANSAYRSNLRQVAAAVIHGSMFQTAFHNTTNNNLSKFSSGDYIYPDTDTGQKLADFVRNTQAQARFANIYGRVQIWAANATPTSLGASSEDVDLDGASEYLLYNSRVFAVFEKKGGRMTAAWLRDGATGNVWQVAGNFASYSNADTEDEGESNFVTGTTTINAYRTSGFKDWWVVTGTAGSSTAVNTEYTVTPTASAAGWMFSQGGISKTITLADATTGNLTAAYSLSGPNKLYVRFGLAPDLLDLMLNGQANLETSTVGSSRLNLLNNAADGPVRAFVETSAGSSINSAATDKDDSGFTTVNLRNQAQTQQVEVEITGNTVITLGFDQGVSTDADNDGLADQWESDNFGDLIRDGTGDYDNDGLTDKQEYVLGSDPKDAGSGKPVMVRDANGFHVTFPTKAGRTYTVKYRDSLISGDWTGIVGNPVAGDGISKTVTDTDAGSVKSRFYRVEASITSQ
ncbi:MAG: hypothetical protein FGM15_01425 [Chthoniobacterales bacterium]|nr:hypothetical protein [Chthoniobacterales bacterium]